MCGKYLTKLIDVIDQRKWVEVDHYFLLGSTNFNFSKIEKRMRKIWTEGKFIIFPQILTHFFPFYISFCHQILNEK